MENNIIEAEFTVVNERTPEAIVAEIKVFEQQVLSGMVEIGRRLFEIKEMVGHGKWYEWIGENLGYKERTVQNFMKIAEKYGDENSPYYIAISKTQKSAHLSISKALALLQVPENDVENFTEKNDIDNMKVKELEAEIKKLKQEKESADQLLENLDKLQNDLDTTKAEKDATYKLLQDLQEQQIQANDGELQEGVKAEIDKLKEQLEKAKKKEEKLKEEKSKIEADKQAEIEDVKKQAMEEATEVAVNRAKEQIDTKVRELTEKAEEALKRAADAEKNLQIAGSEALTKRKVNMNLIGTLATEIASAIAEVKEKDPGQATELTQKTKAFILTLVDLF